MAPQPSSGAVLAGQVAVVTGAGRGIGRAIAERLAAEGARVLVNDNGVELDGSGGDPRVAKLVAEAIRDNGGQAVADATAVGPWSAGEEIVGAAREAFGESPSIVISNAVILRDRMSFNMSEDEWDSVLRTNLHGPFALIRAALPAMRERKSGRIVALTSSAGLVGNLGQVNYASAKAGLVALTRVVALDTARYGITANAVAPFAATRMTERVQPTTPELATYLEGAKRVRPEDVAALVAFLCAPAGAGVSGQVLGVRGKEVMVFNQPRVVRSAVATEGWSIDGLEHTFESWRTQGSLVPLETDLDLFRYPPFV